jgi:Phage P2 baseplate assembly protein gpV
MDLTRLLVDIFRRQAEIERRIDGMVKQGPVAEVDPKAGTVRLRLGGTEEEPFLSPPVPYAQIAGAMKIHSPPSVGQQMTLISGTGDFRQGLAVPMTWSNQNAAPSDKGDEHVLTFGDCRIELRGSEIVVKVPRIFFECEGSTFELTGGGLKMAAPDYEFSQS